jgi:hypothetical protein
MKEDRMNGEQRMWASIVFFVVALLITVAVLGMDHCNRTDIQRGKVLEKCLGMGKSPVECEQVGCF